MESSTFKTTRHNSVYYSVVLFQRFQALIGQRRLFYRFSRVKVAQSVGYLITKKTANLKLLCSIYLCKITTNKRLSATTYGQREDPHQLRHICSRNPQKCKAFHVFWWFFCFEAREKGEILYNFSSHRMCPTTLHTIVYDHFFHIYLTSV